MKNSPSLSTCIDLSVSTVGLAFWKDNLLPVNQMKFKEVKASKEMKYLWITAIASELFAQALTSGAEKRDTDLNSEVISGVSN